ncbi:formylglycine-generating enzyme required for sulfatase activity [Runella defluvii]|uniref:Formylglycine-generating enzyme required for sulfatase activity n=1 Tax=Runella defluvii TaxID=370973 RepID=A0A7W5ZMP8_9BACT|nr:formylglycine-generating enzyme family protein [Runella defluvii]MBB3838676.1 formylglycine-generating enzyme required for sulfatase activity [Runella defluvii]
MQDSYTEFENTPAAFEMLWVEGGVFEMGGESVLGDALPVHSVKIDSFWMGEFTVTQALWAYVMAGTEKENPSDFKGANRPVEKVSHDDIMNEFLPKLKAMTGLAYRLPTEAEWEYAAKGGKYGQKYPFEYAGSNKLEEVGWYRKNSQNEIQVVGLKTPNLLGLYDMSGNVWEWCSDWYDKDFYSASTAAVTVNPTGPTTGSLRVFRGGGWLNYERYCRSTNRDYGWPGIRYDLVGLRLVLSFSVVQAGKIP